METRVDPLIVITVIGIIVVLASIVFNNRKPKGIFDERYISRIFNKYLLTGNLSYDERFYMLRAIHYASSVTVSYYNHETSARELFATVTPKGITFYTPTIMSSDTHHTRYMEYDEQSFSLCDKEGTVLNDLTHVCSEFLSKPKQNLRISSIRLSLSRKYKWTDNK